MFKIVRVNMSDLSVKKEDVPETYQGLGGRGLTTNSLTGDDIASLGQRVLKMEKLPPHNEVFDITDEELDTIFNFEK